MEIYLRSLSPFSSFHFDCAKNRNSLFPFCLPRPMHGAKIYSETFITSKNPTEWSFTWIAFNNNPFPSSVFAPRPNNENFLKISLSTDKIFIYGPRLYSPLIRVVSGGGGSINERCTLRRQWKKNHPIFPTSQPRPVFDTSTVIRHRFTAAALSHRIIYFDNINFYGHKLCLFSACSLRHSRNCLIFNAIFISNILAPAQLYGLPISFYND